MQHGRQRQGGVPGQLAQHPGLEQQRPRPGLGHHPAAIGEVDPQHRDGRPARQRLGRHRPHAERRGDPVGEEGIEGGQDRASGKNLHAFRGCHGDMGAGPARDPEHHARTALRLRQLRPAVRASPRFWRSRPGGGRGPAAPGGLRGGAGRQRRGRADRPAVPAGRDAGGQLRGAGDGLSRPDRPRRPAAAGPARRRGDRRGRRDRMRPQPVAGLPEMHRRGGGDPGPGRARDRRRRPGRRGRGHRRPLRRPGRGADRPGVGRRARSGPGRHRGRAGDRPARAGAAAAGLRAVGRGGPRSRSAKAAPPARPPTPPPDRPCSS